MIIEESVHKFETSQKSLVLITILPSSMTAWQEIGNLLFRKLLDRGLFQQYKTNRFKSGHHLQQSPIQKVKRILQISLLP